MTVRRVAGVVAVAVLVLLVGGLPAQAAGTTMLRLAQFTPDPAGVELVVASVMDPRTRVVAATLRYGEVAAYHAVEPGDYVVTMRPAGSTAPASVSQSISVKAGTAYTVAAVRHTKTASDLAVLTDDLSAPAPDRARVRVVDAVPTAPQLDVRDAADKPVALALTPGAASPYVEVDPGAMAWTVTPPGAHLEFSVPPNQVSSIVLTGHDGTPRATVVVDAAGPADVPPGPVHAGYGGTAGPAPGAAVVTAVLAVLAAVAAGLAVRLSRRA